MTAIDFIRVSALLTLAIAVLVVAVYVIARRHEQLPAAERPKQPDWDAESLADARNDGDPLTRYLAEIELTAPAHIFEELTHTHAVNVEWRPADFTQEWALAGERLRELGDAQVLESVR